MKEEKMSGNSGGEGCDISPEWKNGDDNLEKDKKKQRQASDAQLFISDYEE